MATVTIDDSSLTAIAGAIRGKLDVETTYRPSEMAAAIASIDTSGIELTSADEGKVVVESSGEYVLQAQTSRSVTENGTYDTTTNDSVTVSVSGGGGGGTDVEPTLPSEYQEVEYIDFDGSSYVNVSGRQLQSGDAFAAFVQKLNSDTSEQVFFGSSTTGTGERFEAYSTSTEVRGFIYSSNDTSTSGFYTMTAIDNAVRVSFANNTTTSTAATTAAGQKHSVLMMLANVTREMTLNIGAYGGSYKTRQRVYKIRHTRNVPTTKNGTPYSGRTESVTWYKPCYRKSDNVAGWYDTEAGVFYTNLGTGSFTVGPDVS